MNRMNLHISCTYDHRCRVVVFHSLGLPLVAVRWGPPAVVLKPDYLLALQAVVFD